MFQFGDASRYVTDTMCAPSKSHFCMMAKTPNVGHELCEGMCQDRR